MLFNNIKNINNDISNNNYEKDFIARFKRHNVMSYPYSDSIISTTIHFCYINGYKLNNNLLDYFVSVILLNKHFNKYLFLNYDEASFNEDFIYDKYVNNSHFSERITYTNNYFNNLKKNINDVSLNHNAIDI